METKSKKFKQTKYGERAHYNGWMNSEIYAKLEAITKANQTSQVKTLEFLIEKAFRTSGLKLESTVNKFI